MNHVDERSRDFAQQISKFDMSENVVTCSAIVQVSLYSQIDIAN